MDVDALVAIDVHTHVHRSARGAEHSAEGSGSIGALGEYFGHGGTIGIKDEVRPTIMKENAAARFGLRPGS